ncbi:phenylacetate-CoA ligase [Nocardiopsis mwathae]|uniref:Phenylacetate-CoA ligase n=1 Tax=Nocardiopsis mwathae TaxID=1472723 RepID=A0A7W9YIQ2_9ACTN|nr:hypothetical protein [Nocardiopsis mwathae]MBB6172914.1 phenylacetate-CoA ligase [Nocardiopsis mwathae]
MTNENVRGPWIGDDDTAIGPVGGSGLLLVSPGTGTVAALGPEDRRAAVGVGARTLAAAGVGAHDRVVVALNNEGGQAGTLLAEAAVATGASAAAIGPRGRMRLHGALEAVGATTLVATATGTMDLLSRLHLEFGIDPLDLGLRRVLLAGEITEPEARRRLAEEFDADVVDLLIDPRFHIPLAHGDGTALVPVEPGAVGLAPLTEDRRLAPPYPGGAAEITTCPFWHSDLADATVRTGLVAVPAGGATAVPLPRHTVGDRVLVRGQWLSLARLERALACVDGIAHWTLRVRRPGTLDSAELRVAFTRDSLVGEAMWHRRIEQALAGLTPVRIDLAVEPRTEDERRPGTVADERGHHLARTRTEAERRHDVELPRR